MRILICDPDPEYLKALVTFLINCKNGYEVSSFSDEMMFSESMYEEGFLNQFEYMILASPFYEQVADAVDANESLPEKKVIKLTEEKEKVSENSFYKYQSAELLRRMIRGGMSKQIVEENPRDSPLVTLVSPIHHELLLPYALVLANVYADQDSVLLVDLEQISILPGFCGHEFQRNIMDLAYMLESGAENPEDGAVELCVEDYVEYIDGIAVLAAASNPLEINTLTNKQWKEVINLLKASNYSRIILLFDEMHPGFDVAVRESAEVIMLCRQGVYPGQCTEIFMRMYEKIYANVPLRQAYLQMSAADMPSGNFRLEELLDGKLNGIIRKQLAIGG